MEFLSIFQKNIYMECNWYLLIIYIVKQNCKIKAQTKIILCIFLINLKKTTELTI